MPERPTYEELEQRIRELESNAANLKDISTFSKEKEQMFRHSFENANIGACLVEPDGNFILVNNRMVEIFGYSKKEFEGMNVDDVSHPEDIVISKEVQKRVKTGEIEGTVFQKRYIHKNGRMFWGKVSNSIVRDHDGKPLYFVTHFTDITETKKTLDGFREHQKELESLVNDRTKELSESNEALRESEKKFRQLIENIDEIFWIRDAETNEFLYMSPNIEDIWGLSILKISERPGTFLEALHPDDRERVISIYKEQKYDEAFELEYRIVKPDGTVRWINGKNFPVFDESGKVYRRAGINEDITDRKRAEMDQKKLEQQLSNAMEIAHLGHWEYDVERDLFTFNDQIYKIYRTNAEQVGGYFMSSAEYAKRFVHPEDIEIVGKEIRKSIETNDPNFNQQLEHRILYADGEVGYISVLYFINKDNQGKTVRIYGVNQDITDRKRAEQNYQMLFREMLEGFALHEIICDEAGKPVDYRFIAVNPAFEKMTGLKADQIVGRNVLDVLPGLEPYWINTYGNVALSGEPAFFESYADGIGKHFQVSAFRPSSDQFACIFTDITEIKSMQKRLEQAQKMEAIGSLAGGIAHDFNNILFPIVGMSELLLEDFPPDSPEHENAQEIFNAGKRGSDLVKQILAFSRQSELKKIPIRIQHILKEVMKLSRSTIPVNIEITQDIQSNCGMVQADPTQVHQIAMNLITNAYHAVEPKSGEIAVRLREVEIESGKQIDSDLLPGRYALLSVSDTGVGIDPAILQKIFEPYFTTKEQGKGTGLGLAVVYGIVKEHQGDIKVYSELGKGTTFKVYLPIMAKTGKPAHAEENTDSQVGYERILLVDDEGPIAKLEKQMLERLGYTVIMRVSSVEALEVFKAKPESFDLVISDMTMPQITGDQLAKELISIRADIPVIICTGFSEILNQETASSIGVKGFLMKPIIKSELAKMVRKVLDGAKKS